MGMSDKTNSMTSVLDGSERFCHYLKDFVSKDESQTVVIKIRIWVI